MEYQLVIQSEISADDRTALEDLVKTEEKIGAIASDFEVDGHDIGSGQMNIFVLTSDPETTYRKIRDHLPPARTWVAAYRPIHGDEFVTIEPNGRSNFDVW